MNIKEIKKFVVNIQYQGFAFCFLVAAISTESILFFNLFLGLIFVSLMCQKLIGFPKYRVYAMLCLDVCYACLGFYLAGYNTTSPHNIVWLLGAAWAYYMSYLIEKSYGD